MKKSNKLKLSVLKAVERVAREEVKINSIDWPPICTGIYHQPKRPKAMQ